MSENQASQPENPSPEEHTKEKEASFLARMLGWATGRKQAGAAEPDVKELAERVKELGPDAAGQAMDAAISAYSQERREEEAKESSIKPEE